MRQLKGKVKESKKEKRERKDDFKQQGTRLVTIVLPTLAVIILLIVSFIYVQSRPKIDL